MCPRFTVNDSGSHKPAWKACHCKAYARDSANFFIRMLEIEWRATATITAVSVLFLERRFLKGADPRDRRPLRTNWNLRCRLRFDGGRIRVSGSSPVSRTGGWGPAARIYARHPRQDHSGRTRPP